MNTDHKRTKKDQRNENCIKDKKNRRNIICSFNVKNLSDFRSTTTVRSDVDDDLETGAATLNPLKTKR